MSPTVVICAMQDELAAIQAALVGCETVSHPGLTYHRGKLGSREVIAALCGPGKVNAAYCTSTLIAHCRPAAVLNSGVAGALSPELHVLDTVIATKVCQHDVDSSPLGDPVGMVSVCNQIWFPCDAAWINRLQAAADALHIPTVQAAVATGDQFLADNARKTWIRQTFGAAAVEMEAGAIAQVCALAQVPFACLRVLSDGGDDAAAMTYTAFMPRAAAAAAAVLCLSLESL